jgi:hypothetical protein
MLSIGRISPAAACCSPSSSSFIVRVVPSARAQVTLRADDVHALAFSPIEKMWDVLIIRSMMLRRGRSGTAAINSSYDWVPRRTKRKEAARGCSLRNFSALGAMHTARSDDEGTFPILGARVHRDRKQGFSSAGGGASRRTAYLPVYTGRSSPSAEQKGCPVNTIENTHVYLMLAC